MWLISFSEIILFFSPFFYFYLLMYNFVSNVVQILVTNMASVDSTTNICCGFLCSLCVEAKLFLLFFFLPFFAICFFFFLWAMFFLIWRVCNCYLMCEMVWLAVVSTTKMQEHGGNDKSCVWHATDFVDGELKEEMFAIRFGSVESEFIFPFFCKHITTILCCFSSVLPSLMCCRILPDSICFVIDLVACSLLYIIV